jgi:uncharacterized membrane-anchored protein YhcB (DUF1043 family)
MLQSVSKNLIKGKLERDKIVAALERLKTPRDAAYELEIKRLTDKYNRLEADYNATREMMSEMEEVMAKTENKQLIDLSNLIRTEIIHLKQVRENYEATITQTHAEASQKLRDLAVDYKNITKHLASLEEFVKLSYEGEENHAVVMKVVHNYLKDMKTSLDSVLADTSTGAMDRLIDRIVNSQPKSSR